MEEPKAVGLHDKRCRMASATMGETGYLSSSVSSWNRHRKCIVTEVLIGSPHRCLSLIQNHRGLSSCRERRCAFSATPRTQRTEGGTLSGAFEIQRIAQIGPCETEDPVSRRLFEGALDKSDGSCH